MLKLKTSWSDIEEVQLEISTYRENGGIYIGLISVGGGITEPFGDVTVNLGGSSIDYCGYLNTGNIPELETFIFDNGIGEYTGFSRRSGYNEYPLYIFNAKKLQELCPVGVAMYEQSLKMDGKVEDKQKIR
ncbi:MAG: DUF4313 domain-containing protein [Mobilitalea sp.]